MKDENKNPDSLGSLIKNANDFITAAGAAMSASEEYSNNTKEKDCRREETEGAYLLLWRLYRQE